MKVLTVFVLPGWVGFFWGRGGCPAWEDARGPCGAGVCRMKVSTVVVLPGEAAFISLCCLVFVLAAYAAAKKLLGVASCQRPRMR
jgi:hypothetical protein